MTGHGVFCNREKNGDKILGMVDGIVLTTLHISMVGFPASHVRRSMTGGGHLPKFVEIPIHFGENHLIEILIWMYLTLGAHQKIGKIR